MARFGMLKKINYILFGYIYILFKNQNTAFTTSKPSHKVYRRHNSLIMGGGICGRKISLDEAQMLLSYGQTPNLGGFVSKSGKSFSARLKLEGDRAVFDFD